MIKKPIATKVIAVVGPTGSGKTALAVKLAQKYNGVLISADSRQVYRGLDLGTNKEGEFSAWNGETARTIDDVPQLLIDVVAPGERFTLADWLSEARRLIDRIIKNGQLPIIVGGTGLYVSALLEGYQPGEGRYASTKTPVPFQALILEIELDRSLLHQKSDDRYPRIFDALCQETEQLRLRASDEWLDKIGLDYRYAIAFLTGRLSREGAITQFQAASRQYIRRQLTWWRHHGEPKKVHSTSEALKKVSEFLKSD